MKYHYTRSPAFPHLRGGLPLIEIALYHGEHKKTVSALVDSGAAMSVLPYDTGLELGLAWEKQTVPVDVGGVLKNTPAYGVLVRGEISHLPPVTLAFAWVHRTSDEIRTILGQMNFFQHYRITFEAYNEIFEITKKK
ncbi:MAG: retropepsin-like aspartic protease [Pseudomonadota bacterium]